METLYDSLQRELAQAFKDLEWIEDMVLDGYASFNEWDKQREKCIRIVVQMCIIQYVEKLDEKSPNI